MFKHAPDTTPSDEQLFSESPQVSCDGGGGALGHPRIYLNMGTDKEIYCPYCSRHFILKASANSAHTTH